MAKEWFHQINIRGFELQKELNAFSKLGYEIYKIWKTSYDDYEIIAYKIEEECDGET